MPVRCGTWAMPSSGKSSGVSRTGPRRLWKSIDIRLPGCGDSASRSTAGDDSCSTRSGRSTQTTVSPPCASTCRRRSASGRARPSQTSTAPNAWLRSICSAAQSMSVRCDASVAAGVGRTQYTWRAGSRAAARLAALGK